MWDIGSEGTQIIGLPDNTTAGSVGLYTWIISHLTYPLSWVFDKHDIATLTEREAKGELYVRTSGLVDIPNGSSRIIFVVNTKSTTSVRLGQNDFPVIRTDHRFELPPAAVIRVHQFDETICSMLDEVLSWEGSLRREFEAFCSHMLTGGGINWLELDTVVTLLTVRWHQRVEASRSGEDKLGVGAPSHILQEYYGLAPAGGITKHSYSDYGGGFSVNGLDQRFVSRRRARRHPAIRLGTWNNTSELALTLGLGLFDIHNAENPAQIALRLDNGGIDRMNRGRYLRKGYETWKRGIAISDTIAFPGHDANTRFDWPKLVKDSTLQPGATADSFSRAFVSDYYTYGWNMNVGVEQTGTSLTGIRLPSSA